MTGSGPSRRAPSGPYRWAIALVLGILVVALFAIVVAVLAAAFGLWPVSS
jgi:hypothetical protein